MNKLVDFPGHGRFWFRENDGTFLPKGSGPLAPLDHCDENGDIKDLVIGLTGLSYANVYDTGEIKRLGIVIGKKEDLVEVKS